MSGETDLLFTCGAVVLSLGLTALSVVALFTFSLGNSLLSTASSFTPTPETHQSNQAITYNAMDNFQVNYSSVKNEYKILQPKNALC